MALMCITLSPYYKHAASYNIARIELHSTPRSASGAFRQVTNAASETVDIPRDARKIP